MNLRDAIDEEYGDGTVIREVRSGRMFEMGRVQGREPSRSVVLRALDARPIYTVLLHEGAWHRYDVYTCPGCDEAVNLGESKRVPGPGDTVAHVLVCRECGLDGDRWCDRCGSWHARPYAVKHYDSRTPMAATACDYCDPEGHAGYNPYHVGFGD